MFLGFFQRIIENLFCDNKQFKSTLKAILKQSNTNQYIFKAFIETSSQGCGLFHLIISGNKSTCL